VASPACPIRTDYRSFRPQPSAAAKPVKGRFGSERSVAYPGLLNDKDAPWAVIDLPRTGRRSRLLAGHLIGHPFWNMGQIMSRLCSGWA
jgi:hypothetical protein